MLINEALDAHGEAAQRGILLKVTIEAEPAVHLRATADALILLGHVLLGLVDEAECHFSIHPFFSGKAYFHQSGDGPGLYLHRQPCWSGVNLTGSRGALAWICFRDYFRDVPADERVYDPSFIVLEGEDDYFQWIAGMILQAASSGNRQSLTVQDLNQRFGPTGSLGLLIEPLTSAT